MASASNRHLDPQYKKKYYKRNREKHLAYCRQIYLRDRKKRVETARRRRADGTERRLRLLREWGLSLEEIIKRLRKQRHKCPICRRRIRNEKQSFKVDHDHTTGKIRGLLCRECNLGLGMFKDNIQRLERAKKYLRKSKHI